MFSHNLRQKNAKRWGRKVVKAVRGAYDRCIILFQEVASWEAADIDTYAIVSKVGCDCAVGVPSHLRSNIEKSHNDEFFTAIQIFSVCFVFVHLPHSGRPDDEVYSCMTRISALIHNWKSHRKPVKHVILGGDLNVTLPSNLHPITGPHVFNRCIRNKERVTIILDWLAELSLVALNTFPPEKAHSQQSWTRANTKGSRTQIDYIFMPQGFAGHAWVECPWKIPSDHFPVCAAISALQKLGTVPRPFFTPWLDGPQTRLAPNWSSSVPVLKNVPSTHTAWLLL